MLNKQTHKDFVCIWFFVCVVFYFNHAQNTDFLDVPSFEHITDSEGLSQSYISALTQDQQGFIWIGTWDGLNRYDGYEFKIIKNKIDDSTSISYDNIRSFIGDQRWNICDLI